MTVPTCNYCAEVPQTISAEDREVLKYNPVLRKYPGNTVQDRRRSCIIHRLTGITWNYSRDNIPNRDGYQFIALMRDGTHWTCQVVKAEDGCFTVLNGLFPEIVAWRDLNTRAEERHRLRISGGTVRHG